MNNKRSAQTAKEQREGAVGATAKEQRERQPVTAAAKEQCETASHSDNSGIDRTRVDHEQ